MYSNELICNILDYIDVNLQNKITIKDISDNFFYNRTYIMKLFKKEIGVTVFDYINKMKIESSIRQIYNFPKDNLLKIAYQSGFYSLEYFSEIFKREIGVSPRICKCFLLKKDDLNQEDREKIMINVLKLDKLKQNTLNYRTNKKPKETPVKVMSIFRDI